jgi:hypothetical protein
MIIILSTLSFVVLLVFEGYRSLRFSAVSDAARALEEERVEQALRVARSGRRTSIAAAFLQARGVSGAVSAFKGRVRRSLTSRGDPLVGDGGEVAESSVPSTSAALEASPSLSHPRPLAFAARGGCETALKDWAPSQPRRSVRAGDGGDGDGGGCDDTGGDSADSGADSGRVRGKGSGGGRGDRVPAAPPPQDSENAAVTSALRFAFAGPPEFAAKVMDPLFPSRLHPGHLSRSGDDTHPMSHRASHRAQRVLTASGGLGTSPRPSTVHDAVAPPATLP